MSSLYNQPPAPASKHSVALYVTYLHVHKNLAASTIRSRLSAISYFHKINDLDIPTNSYTISKLLSSYAKDSPRVTLQRKPISYNLLCNLLHGIYVYPHSRYDSIMFRALFILMYEAALRISEVTFSKYNDHNIQVDQVKASKHSIVITFISYKHSPASPYKVLIPSNTSKSCPVKLYHKYLSVRKPGPGPVFLQANGKPLTSAFVTRSLKSFLRVLNLNTDCYNTHSFRIGKATDLALSGYSDSNIALIGRWKSDAFKKYLKPDTVKTS
jgi:site-specific recombinase XerD